MSDKLIYFFNPQIYPGCSHSPEACKSKATKTDVLVDNCDLKTLTEAVKRKSQAMGVSEPGPSKQPPSAPHQWSHKDFDMLQKEGNFTDRQMRVIAKKKR